MRANIRYNFNVSEKKVMDAEIKRQLAEYDRKNTLELEAIILWALYEQFGFGKKRLKRFYDSVDKSIADLIKRYEMNDSDDAWLCTEMLRRIGIDVEAWSKEQQ